MENFQDSREGKDLRLVRAGPPPRRKNDTDGQRAATLEAYRRRINGIIAGWVARALEGQSLVQNSMLTVSAHVAHHALLADCRRLFIQLVPVLCAIESDPLPMLPGACTMQPFPSPLYVTSFSTPS